MSYSLPVFLATGAIETVWPSRYLALKRCMLREAATVGGQDPLMPQSPRAQVGTGVHSLFERAASDSSFPTDPVAIAAEWDKMVAVAEHRLSGIPYMQAAVPLARSVLNIGLLRSRTLNNLAEVRAAAVRTRPSRSSPHEPIPAGKLSNKAGTVVGVPDRVFHTSDGVVISDFKTGTFLHPDGSLAPGYQAQLQLYAALFHETYGEWPVRLEIVSITGTRVIVPGTAKECQEVLADAHQLCLDAREKSPGLSSNPDAQAAVAGPKPEICRLCPFRPRCPAYITSALSEVPLCQSDVAGGLCRWSTSGNGAIFVQIETTTGIVGVRSIPPAAADVASLISSRPGDKALIVNLRQDTPSLVTATNYTAVHTYCSRE
ncbi:MAG: PD-(D/E)XK nuclease family protein [Verrucomicrobiia bacterium]